MVARLDHLAADFQASFARLVGQRRTQQEGLRGQVEAILARVAAWVVRSQSFADKVWSLLEPENVEITLFSLPGEKRPNDPGPGGRKKSRSA